MSQAYVVKQVNDRWVVAVEDSVPLTTVYEDTKLTMTLIEARRIAKKEETTVALMDEKNRIYSILDYRNMLRLGDILHA